MLIRIAAFQRAYLSPVLKYFLQGLKGATAVEYGLIAGGISIVIMVAVFAVGSDMKSMFTYMESKMSSAATKVK